MVLAMASGRGLSRFKLKHLGLQTGSTWKTALTDRRFPQNGSYYEARMDEKGMTNSSIEWRKEPRGWKLTTAEDM